MGLFWSESYSILTSGNRQSLNGTIATSFSSQVTGRGFYSVSPVGASGQSYFVFIAGADQDDYITIGTAIYSSGLVTNEVEIFRFKSDANTTTHLTITYSGVDKKLRARVGPGTGGAVIATSAATIGQVGGVWNFVEASVRLSDTIGEIVLAWDDTVVYSGSGLDTKNAGTLTVFDTVQIIGSFWTAQDDTYVTNEQGSVNTGRLGPVHIVPIVPDGNGATSNGTGSDGNSVDNYLLVDEAISTVYGVWDSDYVDFAATGDKDTYTYTSPGASVPTTLSVPAVMVCTQAYKSDAGARHAAALSRLSGTEAAGADMPLLNTSMRVFCQPFETKPAGGAWTVSDVNSAEFGVKATA